MFVIPENAAYILNIFKENGFKAYIVGGCVRDILMGKTPNDYDITTNAKPQEIKTLFPHTADTGIKHGTVSIIIKNEVYETTTFRIEGTYSDFRSPDGVCFIESVDGDLARRDFTVNAMCYNEQDGIIDLFEGQEDIKNKILRTVGNPNDRFSEDALRIMRLFRFSSTLGFNIDEETEKAAYLKADNLKNISVERIFEELKKTVMGDNIAAFENFINCGALAFSGIKKCKDADYIRKLTKNQNLRLFAFLSQCNADIKALDTLKASNEIKEYFKELSGINLNNNSGKVEIKHQLNRFKIENIKDYIEYRTAKENSDFSTVLMLLDEIIKNNEPYKISHLKINGDDLKSLGICGEDIGKTLTELLNTVIENPEKNEKSLLEKLIKN